MQKHILIGAGLLLTLGTALAGTFMHDSNTVADPAASLGVELQGGQISPARIASWTSTAMTRDFITPKVPL